VDQQQLPRTQKWEENGQNLIVDECHSDMSAVLKQTQNQEARGNSTVFNQHLRQILSMSLGNSGAVPLDKLLVSLQGRKH